MNALAAPFVCFASLAVAAPLQVRSLTMKAPSEGLPASASGWADGSVKMPFISSDPVTVGARITALLFVSHMGMAPPTRPGDSFAPQPDQLPEGTASQEFEVTRNDARVLTIAFDIEGCGAYCESYRQLYSFDARNGRLLALEELLTPGSLSAVAEQVGRDRAQRYAAQLQGLKRDLAAAQKSHAAVDVIDDLQLRIDLNQECLEREQGRPRDAASLRFARFSLPSNGLVLHTERCSNHATRALDDVGDVDTSLSAADLTKWLTPYGKALVLGQGDAPPPASVFGQLLRGKVGSAAVTLQLDLVNSDDSLSGRYFYERYARVIPLQGKRSGNTLTLTEEADGKKAELTLTVRGDSITGHWQGNGKTLPVVLQQERVQGR